MLIRFAWVSLLLAIPGCADGPRENRAVGSAAQWRAPSSAPIPTADAVELPQTDDGARARAAIQWASTMRQQDFTCPVIPDGDALSRELSDESCWSRSAATQAAIDRANQEDAGSGSPELDHCLATIESRCAIINQVHKRRDWIQAHCKGGRKILMGQPSQDLVVRSDGTLAVEDTTPAPVVFNYPWKCPPNTAKEYLDTLVFMSKPIPEEIERDNCTWLVKGPLWAIQCMAPPKPAPQKRSESRPR
jgi:hypothetical protein